MLISNRRRKTQGFTLIEVLVSITIFASLSLAAYQVVSQVLRSNVQSLERTERLNEIQRALVLMDNDFRQMALRRLRSEGEAPAEKILNWAGSTTGVIFPRVGWHNPEQQFPRGEVTKVGYRINGETLERLWWRYPDTPAGQDALVTPLLTEVEDFDLKFFDDGQWKSEWTKSLELPRAVSVELTMKDYGEISRIYLTPDGVLKTSDQGEQDE